MNEPHGILRLLRSSKFFTACIGTVLALLPIIFAAPDLAREEKLAQWRNFVIAASSLWAGVIVMNGVEDYAAKRDAPAGVGPAPSVMVNTGSDATNTQSPAAPLPLATTTQSPSVGTFTRDLPKP